MPSLEPLDARRWGDDQWEITASGGQRVFIGSADQCEQWLDLRENRLVAGKRNVWRVLGHMVALVSMGALLLTIVELALADDPAGENPSVTTTTLTVP